MNSKLLDFHKKVKMFPKGCLREDLDGGSLMFKEDKGRKTLRYGKGLGWRGSI
jgi:hypothetical protein